jgi:hypothetical protein
MTDDDTPEMSGFDTHEADDVERVTDDEEYRSLLKISPNNEAENCETPADCDDLIDAELDRDNPRQWVIGIFNERKEELKDGGE